MRISMLQIARVVGLRFRTLLVAAVLLASLDARAHPGGLNSSGCHNEKATGSYHCHNRQSGDQASPDGYMHIQAAPSRPTTRPRPAPVRGGQYVVISVGDGDTIRVRDASGKPITVRLACIDAPETAQEPTGRMATDKLTNLLLGGGGLVSLLPQETDRYGRTVAEVSANGRNVNLEMVSSGNAYAYREYLDRCNANAYLQAEAQARFNRIGVWQYVQEYPWEFRKNRRSK